MDDYTHLSLEERECVSVHYIIQRLELIASSITKQEQMATDGVRFNASNTNIHNPSTDLRMSAISLYKKTHIIQR